MFNKKMMQLPGVSVKRSVLIGLLRSLSFLTDIAIIIYLADILALLCGAHTSGGSPAAHVYGCFHSVLPAAAGAAAASVTVPALILVLVRILLSRTADTAAVKSDETVARALTSDMTHAFLVPQDISVKSLKSSGRPNQTLAMLDTEGIKTVCSYFSNFIPAMVQTAFMICTAVLIFLPFNVWAGIAIAAGMLVMPVFANMIRDSNLKYLSAHLSKYDKVGIHFEQAVRGLSTLTIFRADKRESEKIREESEGFRRITMQILKGQLRSLIAADFVIAAAVIASALIAVFTSAPAFPAGAAGTALPAAAFNGILVAVLGVRLFIPERSLIYLVHDAAKAMKLGRQIVEVRDDFTAGQQAPATAPLTAPDTASVPAPSPIPAQAGDSGGGYRVHAGTAGTGADTAVTSTAGDELISLSGLSVAYSDGFEALRGITASFKVHGFVGIAGRSGSGKSTLVNVITGLLPQYAGSAIIDGREASSYSYAELSHLAVAVRGTDTLFAGTIADNMDIGRRGISREHMVSALKRVDMWPELEGRGGLDAPVSAGGSNFSGGQRQRLCIARGLLHNAQIYIFDEATSAVDAAHDRALERLLLDLSHEACVIAVTHRLSNIRHADTIMMLDGGNIAEMGTYDELMGMNGLFADQWRHQHAVENAGAAPEQDRGHGPGPGAEAAAPAAAVRGVPGPVPGSGRQRRAGSAALFRTVKRMARFLGSHRRTVAGAAAAGLTGHLLSTIAVMAAVMAIFAGFQGHTAVCALLAVIASTAGLVRGMFSFLEQYLNHQAAFSILRDVRVLAFDHVRSLSPAGVAGQARGNLVTVLTEDIELLEVFYAHTLSPLMIGAGNSIIMWAVLSAIHPLLGGIALGSYLIVGILIPLFFAGPTSAYAYKERQSQGQVHTQVLDYLDGKNTLLQFDASNEAYSQVMDASGTMLGSRSRATSYRYSNMRTADAASLIMLILFTLAAASLAAHGNLSVAPAFAAVTGFATSFPSLISVSRLGAGLQPTLASARRVFALLDEKPAAAPIIDGARIETMPFTGETASQMGFSYSNGRAVLRNIDLTIAPGSSIAVQGPNGAGKSTLIDLLMRFRVRGTGNISINSTDINTVATDSLRTVQTLSSQDIFIFDSTLRDNIAVADPDASENRIMQAAHYACLDDLIDQLPDGLDTQLSRNGSQLSDGQRQRVAIARSFLSSASLMFFDEPTSNMDALLEAELMQSLMEHQGSKSYVIVSHRGSTLRYAQELFTLEGGALARIR
ncbi:MAG: ATP-binding cassette domain-containing protein [Scardovia wiggsiae]|uniref:ABC transporter ATP-binding protein/permease n=1 Tax=Scardovia wiggsiae TaxID=230143 RepID=UPI00360E7179